jgi:serine/threonine protein kinase
MAITSGTKFNSYEVLAQIGVGGMGEVYQAHDSKLGRDVAIKVLPEAFAHDGDRLARFQREAKMLAALNHPNIATIYGLEQSGARTVGRRGWRCIWSGGVSRTYSIRCPSDVSPGDWG